jgi:hypothetical protein
LTEGLEARQVERVVERVVAMKLAEMRSSKALGVVVDIRAGGQKVVGRAAAGWTIEGGRCGARTGAFLPPERGTVH